MNIPCHDCGCPHTTIKRHVEWAGLKFFLAERSCDNCGNTWMSLEPLGNLQKNSYFKKILRNKPISCGYYKSQTRS